MLCPFKLGEIANAGALPTVVAHPGVLVGREKWNFAAQTTCTPNATLTREWWSELFGFVTFRVYAFDSGFHKT